jgi:glycosyltransferase involved in cell wall biosynthesis
VDDGSNKNIVGQIDNMIKLSDKITVFHNPVSKGTSFARNLAINKATGDLIIFLDDDDLIHPKMVESGLPLFDERIDIVSSPFTYFLSREKNSEQLIANSDRISEDGSMLFIKPVDNVIERKKLEQQPFHEILRNSFPVHTSITRKRCIGTVRFEEDLKLGEDTYFWLTLAHKGCNFRFNDKVEAFYRLHNSNHARRLQNIQLSSLKYLLKLESSGMLQEKDDFFFVNSQIFINLFRLRDAKCMKYLFYMLGSPKLFADLLIKTLDRKILRHDDIIHKQIKPYF